MVKKSNSKVIGEKTEGQILARLLQLEKTVLIPFGDNQRYDLVIDDNGKFLRIQCKTGRFKNGAIIFDTCSSYCHRGGKKVSYINQIEYFAVYCPDNHQCYMISIDEVANTKCTLRIDQPKNNNSKNIRMASDYIL